MSDSRLSGRTKTVYRRLSKALFAVVPDRGFGLIPTFVVAYSHVGYVEGRLVASLC
jgi:hypothetical protein